MCTNQTWKSPHGKLLITSSLRRHLCVQLTRNFHTCRYHPCILGIIPADKRRGYIRSTKGKLTKQLTWDIEIFFKKNRIFLKWNSRNNSKNKMTKNDTSAMRKCHGRCYAQATYRNMGTRLPLNETPPHVLPRIGCVVDSLSRCFRAVEVLFLLLYWKTIFIILF